jgi:hypothetical protein
MFHLSHLKIDDNAALDYSNKKFQISQSISTNDDERLKKTYFQRMCEQLNIQKIKNKDFTFSQSSTNQRVYTNLTSLNKEYRRFLTYNELPLYELDLKSSQPYLLLHLFNPNFWCISKTNTQQLSLVDIQHSDLYIEPKLNLEICNFIKKNNSNSDFLAFNNSVLSGSLYNDMHILFYSKPISSPEDKASIKEKVFTMLFASNYQRNQAIKDDLELFKKHYPTIHTFCKMIKRNQRNLKIPKAFKQHSRLAILLQRMEAHLIINNVAGHLAVHNPSVPLLTLHDSCFTTKEHLPMVKELLLESCQKLFGAIPSIN